MRVTAIVCLIVLHAFSFGQDAKPCSAPEASQFDFWIGEWDLSWTGEDGTKHNGTNIISKILGDCVIQENFNAPGMSFRGMSVSVFDSKSGKWKQTWVDDAGGYLDFMGEYRDGRMVLQRVADPDGKPFLQRMIWYNISADTLDWNWERSDDNGATWRVLWNIHYSRKK